MAEVVTRPQTHFKVGRFLKGVQHNDLTSVKTAVARRRAEGNWDPRHWSVTMALLLAPSTEVAMYLKDQGATISSRCLPSAVQKGNVGLLGVLVSCLKKMAIWDPDDWYVVWALVEACCAPNYEVKKALEKHGAKLTSKCLPLVVRNMVLSCLRLVVTELKTASCWNPVDRYVSLALIETQRLNKRNMYVYLINQGARPTTQCLLVAVRTSDSELLKDIIYYTKIYRKWNDRDRFVNWALEEACLVPDENMYEILVAEGAVPTGQCLLSAVRSNALHLARKVVSDMKTKGTWIPTDWRLASAKDRVKSLKNSHEWMNLLNGNVGPRETTPYFNQKPTSVQMHPETHKITGQAVQPKPELKTSINPRLSQSKLDQMFTVPNTNGRIRTVYDGPSSYTSVRNSKIPVARTIKTINNPEIRPSSLGNKSTVKEKTLPNRSEKTDNTTVPNENLLSNLQLNGIDKIKVRPTQSDQNQQNILQNLELALIQGKANSAQCQNQNDKTVARGNKQVNKTEDGSRYVELVASQTQLFSSQNESPVPFANSEQQERKQPQTEHSGAKPERRPLHDVTARYNPISRPRFSERSNLRPANVPSVVRIRTSVTFKDDPVTVCLENGTTQVPSSSLAYTTRTKMGITMAATRKNLPEEKKEDRNLGISLLEDRTAKLSRHLEESLSDLERSLAVARQELDDKAVAMSTSAPCVSSSIERELLHLPGRWELRQIFQRAIADKEISDQSRFHHEAEKALLESQEKCLLHRRENKEEASVSGLSQMRQIFDRAIEANRRDVSASLDETQGLLRDALDGQRETTATQTSPEMRGALYKPMTNWKKSRTIPPELSCPTPSADIVLPLTSKSSELNKKRVMGSEPLTSNITKEERLSFHSVNNDSHRNTEYSSFNTKLYYRQRQEVTKARLSCIKNIIQTRQAYRKPRAKWYVPNVTRDILLS